MFDDIKDVNKFIGSDEVVDRYEEAIEINPGEGLIMAIVNELSRKMIAILKSGSFIPGKAHGVGTDFRSIKEGNSLYHFLINEMVFEFNGRERKLLTIPFSMEINQVDENSFEVVKIMMLPKWRGMFMAGNVGKCILPGSKTVEGVEVVKSISDAGLNKILELTQEKILSKLEGGAFTIKEIKKLNKVQDDKVEEPKPVEVDDDTMFEERVRLSEGDIRYLVNCVKNLL